MRMLVKDIITEFSVRNKEGKAYPVYSVTNSQGFCKDYFGKEVASKDKSSYKIVPYGFFAYNPSRINVGSIDWQHCEENVIVSPLYNVFEVKTSIAKIEYLSYYFKSHLVSDFINTFAKGTVRLNIPLSTLGDFPISVPPLSEQQRIVNELDLLSSIIEKKKAQLKEYDQLAQSIFYDMFGDPVTNEKGWEVNSFGNIASFKNGINYHPKNEGYSIKCIGVGDFQDRRELRDFNLIRDLNIDEVIDESYYLKDGDIIIVRSNGSKELVGRNMIVYPQDKKVTYSGFCIRCRLNSLSILPIVLNRILSDRGTMMVLRQEGRGCNISNINQKILSSLPIVIPPLSLQQFFSSKIEVIERQKALIQQSINEVETLFNSRMDYYFN